jgi:vancomycin resistance protein YoaR
MPWRKPRWWALAAVCLLVAAWFGTGLTVRGVYAGRIMPGVTVAGIDVGGLSPVAVRAKIAASLGTAGSVTLTYEVRKFTVRADGVGYRMDAAATAQKAMAVGRRGAGTWLWSGTASLWAKHSIEPVDRVDAAKLDSAVSSIAARIGASTDYGTLTVRGDPPKVRATPPEHETPSVDRRATGTLIHSALRGTSPRRVVLPVDRRTVDQATVDRVAQRAQTYLAQPLRLTGEGISAELTAAQLGHVLAIEPTSDHDGVQLGVDDKKLTRLADALAGKLDRKAVDARFRAPARPLVVDDKGEMSWKPRTADVKVTPSRPGRRLDRRAAAQAVADAVRSGSHDAKLRLSPRNPRVPTDAARKVDSLIGTFTTHFICCQPRVTNIKLIAKAADGTVIMPGKRFSLNKVSGPRTEEKGYVKAPFINKGKLVPDVGGGVSQFSTTTYNAAYFAGLQIDHHQPHSEYISRYPPGREATLNFPTIDLNWTNDTDAPVLIRTATTATSVTVSLYGNNGGRKVTALTGPRKSAQGRDFVITVTRVITHPDRRVVRQPFTTPYNKPAEGE